MELISGFSPILYRTFYLLTPPSELPPLPLSLYGRDSSDPRTEDPTSPPKKPSYLPIHIYTLLQILLTVAIFILTLTKGAPAFPVLIIALVPCRLLLMNRWWPREVLRFVDAWACREGTPEDDEDASAARAAEEAGQASAGPAIGRGSDDSAFCPQIEVLSSKSGVEAPGHQVPRATSRTTTPTNEIWPVDEADWIELEVLENMDEELGRRRSRRS